MLERALELLSELSDGHERRSIELDLIVASAIALQTVRGFAASEVEARYLKARALSEAVDDVEHRFNIEWGLFLTTLVKGNMAEADDIAAKLFARARSDHPTQLSDSNLAMGMVALNLGKFQRAHTALKRSMELVPQGPAGALENAFGQLPWNFCASQLCFTLWFEGFKQEATALISQNLDVARSHFRGSVRAYNYVATLAWAVRVHQCRRDAAEVQRLTNEIISISRKFGYAYYDAQATAYLGWAIAISNHDPERGIAMMHSGLSALKVAKTELGLRGHFIHLAEALCRLGRKFEATIALKSAGGAGGMGVRCWDAEFHRVQALIHLLGPIRDERAAEAELQQSLMIAQLQNAKALELRTAVTFGRYLFGDGRVAEAKTVLAAALKNTAEDRDDPERAELKILLG